eukprot:gene10504-4669_t
MEEAREDGVFYIGGLAIYVLLDDATRRVAAVWSACMMRRHLVRKMATSDLYLAIKDDDVAKIKDAIRNGAVVNYTPEEGAVSGQTPLIYAALKGKAAALKLLLELGADVKIGEQKGYTAIHGAAYRGQPEIVQILADHGVLDVNDVHDDGFPPLFRAAWGETQGHTDAVKALVAAGADPFFEVNGAVAVDQTPNDETEEFLLLQEKIRDRKLQREKKEREKAKAASKDSPRQEF